MMHHFAPTSDVPMFFGHNSTLAAPFGASMAGICIILTRAMMHHAKRHMYMLCSGVVFVNKNSRSAGMGFGLLDTGSFRPIMHHASCIMHHA